MDVFTNKKHIKNQKERYNESQDKSTSVLEDGMFKVSDKIKTEYDMWVWIYQEIANLRLEVSRLATYVRINNQQSPTYLETYHAHIYSLLIPVSTVIPDKIWRNVDNKWLTLKQEIIEFYKQRASTPNKKIPFKLIRDLDTLYRIALLAAQKAGLGIRITFDQDIDKSIENAITGT
jgi:hypothetical protein